MKFFCLVSLFILVFCDSLVASHERVVCSNHIESEVVGDLIVARDSYCWLSDVEVAGNIRIKPGGTLIAYGIFVHGSVLAHAADTVFISHHRDSVESPSLIKGNVRVRNADSVQIVLSVIEGYVLLRGNSVALSNSNEIFGSLVFLHNELAQVSNNWVSKNLICRRNHSFTDVSSGNLVEGRVSRQCAEFTIEP